MAFLACNMTFFGGFGFKDEVRIFEQILRDLGYLEGNPYNICGFSYGAQKAVDYAVDSLKNGSRINRVILLSPAFFNDKSDDFVAQQLKMFAKNRTIYMKAFYKNIGVCECDEAFLREVETLDLRILEKCLRYKFVDSDLEALSARGVEIVVLLGGADKIINANNANEFFSKYGVVYLLKNANHLLR